MDHLDRIKQNLEVLGLESLEEVPLVQLLEAVREKLPPNLGAKRILNIFVMWLHHRLMTIDVSAEDVLRQEIAAWYGCIIPLASGDQLILEAFHEWQVGESAQDPASSRRLSMAAEELLGLIQFSATRPESRALSPESEHCDGGMIHPARVTLFRDIRAGNMGDEAETFVNFSGNRRRDRGRDAQLDSSFMTRSPRLAPDDTAVLPPQAKWAQKTTKGTAVSRPVAPPPDESRGREAGRFKRPPKGYVCDRCHRAGHLLQECPTNMDPRYDRIPPANYKCKICKRSGDHYIALCPKNTDPNSVTQQRRKSAEARGRFFDGPPVDYRSTFRDDRALLNISIDVSNARLDGSVAVRGRSRSPRRDSNRYQLEDWYCSGRGFDGLQFPSFRNRQSKRKGSRSPSPGRYAQPAKSHLRWSVGETEGHNPPAFHDDPLVGTTEHGEGRLSYDDGVYGSVYPTPPCVNVASSSSMLEMEPPARPETFVSQESEGMASASVAENQRMGSDILEMIREESTKTDLLLFINNAERFPPCNRFLVSLFRGGGMIWVNETLKKGRPCSTEFFDIPVESLQQVEAPDCTMPAEAETAKDGQQETRLPGETQALESAMACDEPGAPVTPGEDEVAMVDAGAATASACDLDSVITAAGGLQFDKPAFPEAEPDYADTGDTAAPADEAGHIAVVLQEPALANAEIEQYTLPTSKAMAAILTAPQEAGSGEMVPSSLLPPAEWTATEIEDSPTQVSHGTVAAPVKTDPADAPMTDV